MFNHARVIAIFLAIAILAATPSLQASWPSDGRAICTVPGTQDTPVIVADGLGGAIIVFRDNRAINTDIYAQRVDADGNVLWLVDAMPICTANNVQSLPLVIPDGSGGAIIAWQDFRSGNVVDIYAQRVNSSGYVQWTANGVAVCTGRTGLAMSQMIPDGAGGAIIAWYDRRNATNDIFVQRISGGGVVAWTANGVTVCAAAGSQTNPVLTSDGAGGAIIAWQDQRIGNWNIYAQKVNAVGAVQWAANGIVLCDAALSQTSPQIISDGSGGAIIAWTDHRNALDDDVYAQRVDASGNPMWTANGAAVVASMTGNQRNCRIVPGGSGEALVAWVDYRGGSGDVYAQKMNASGTPLWASNGVAVCAATGNQVTLQLMSDGSGGAVATWEDERNGTGAWDLYAQRFNANGAMAWATNGVAICRATANQTTPQLGPDGWGGAIITWKDERAGNADIYAQRVDAGGHTVVATMLQSYSAAFRERGIEISWTLSQVDEGIEFFIARASEPAGPYIDLPSHSISRDGLSFDFVDQNWEPGVSYWYKVDVRVGSGRSVLFETGPVTTPALPLTLHQNHPNPFNPSTTIGYYLPEKCPVKLEVYDTSGRRIAGLIDKELEKGSYAVEWNGRDGRGNSVASGIYFYRLIAGKQTISKKMLLLK
jgi:hypothetical protein